MDSFDVSRVEMCPYLSDRMEIAHHRYKSACTAKQRLLVQGSVVCKIRNVVLPSWLLLYAAPSSDSNICIGWPGMMVEIACL
jgi:hypothetical protein